MPHEHTFPCEVAVPSLAPAVFKDEEFFVALRADEVGAPGRGEGRERVVCLL
ncbi:MAG: hypothetical protein K2K65_03625 [Duncaniella sp.]|nr:hypothetical protein [Duncaniella sp.]